MKIERCLVDDTEYKLGDKVTVGDVSIKIKCIERDPTGMVIFIGAQGRMIVLGNVPYTCYMTPSNKQEEKELVETYGE